MQPACCLVATDCMQETASLPSPPPYRRRRIPAFIETKANFSLGPATDGGGGGAGAVGQAQRPGRAAAAAHGDCGGCRPRYRSCGPAACWVAGWQPPGLALARPGGRGKGAGLRPPCRGSSPHLAPAPLLPRASAQVPPRPLSPFARDRLHSCGLAASRPSPKRPIAPSQGSAPSLPPSLPSPLPLPLLPRLPGSPWPGIGYQVASSSVPGLFAIPKIRQSRCGTPPSRTADREVSGSRVQSRRG